MEAAPGVFQGVEVKLYDRDKLWGLDCAGLFEYAECVISTRHIHEDRSFTRFVLCTLELKSAVTRLCDSSMKLVTGWRGTNKSRPLHLPRLVLD